MAVIKTAKDKVAPPWKSGDILKRNAVEIRGFVNLPRRGMEWVVIKRGVGNVTVVPLKQDTDWGNKQQTFNERYFTLKSRAKKTRSKKVQKKIGAGDRVRMNEKAAKTYNYGVTLPGTEWYVNLVRAGGTMIQVQKGPNEVGPAGQMDVYADAAEVVMSAAEQIEADKKRIAAETAKGVILDPNTHDHLWQYRWVNNNGGVGRNGYRFCHCGMKEWKLACWTGDMYTKKVPDGYMQQVLKGRPDIDELKIKMIGPLDWIKQGYRTRFIELIGDDVISEPINIIGCGAIGSFIALSLAKMGFNDLRLWDDQKVDDTNVGTQLYGQNYAEANMFKVDALHQLLIGTIGPTAADLKVTVYKKRYTNEPLVGVVVAAVDSMAARKTIWEAQKGKKKVVCVVDGRMGAEQALMYCMSPNNEKDIASYEKTLYTDEKALAEPCTRAGTVYTAQLITGLMGKTIKDALNESPRTPRIAMWDIRNNFLRVYTREDANPAPTSNPPEEKVAAAL